MAKHYIHSINFVADGSGDRLGLSPDWFEKVQAALHKKKEDRSKSKKKSSLSTDNVLEHIHARFSELAASTLAAANAAVTNEIEARAIVKSEKKGLIFFGFFCDKIGCASECSLV